MLISTDGPTKLIFNSQVLLNLVRKYSTGNSLLDTWLTFYEKAKNNNASIIIHVLNICRVRDREKNYKAVMQTIQFEGVPICSMCRYKQMTYMYSVSLTTGPIHKHYPHYPDTCTLCLFMSVQFSDPHQPSAHHPQLIMGSPWLYFGL